MQQFKFHLLVAGLMVSLLQATQARADLKIHGYADLTASATGSDLTLPALNNKKRELNFDGASDFGLNLSADLGNHLDFAGQVVARGAEGYTGQPGYILTADWLFLSYRPTDEWLGRAGRQIYPLFLYSEQIDVGFTYLWAHLPQSVYSITPLKSFNGLLGGYNYNYGDLRFSAAAYGGSGTVNQVATGGIDGLDIFDEHVRGAYMAVESDIFKILLTYKVSHPTVTYSLASPSGTQTNYALDMGTLKNWGAGARFDNGRLVVMSEATGFDSNLPNVKETGAYAMAGYHFLSGRLTPHLTYGRLWSSASYLVHPDPATVATSGNGAIQKLLGQTIAGLNFRVTSSVTAKLEYQRDQFDYGDTKLNFAAETYSVALCAVF